MSKINLEAASRLFDTQMTLQYQNRFKLQDIIEERHGLRGTNWNVPVSDLVEMVQTNFAPTDIFVTPVNETNVQVPTNDYHLKTVIDGGEKTLYNFDKIVNHSKLHGMAAARLTNYIKINAIFSDSDFYEWFKCLILGENLVGPLGLEPRTNGLWVRCSNQLSYGPCIKKGLEL